MALESLGLVKFRFGFEEERSGNTSPDPKVEGTVILELKAARSLDKAHGAQLLYYLRATEVEVGLLLNFGVRPQFRRLLFDRERKKIRENPCDSVANHCGSGVC